MPVAVNSGLFWKRRSLIRRPGKVLVEILPAIPPGLDRHLVIEMLQSRIEDATAALVGESRRSAP